MRSTKWRCFSRDRSCFGLLFSLRSVRDFVASALYAANEPRVCPICACSVTQDATGSLTVEPYVFHTECFKCAICALRVSPSANPQIRSGGQRILCQKCVKNGYRPTQPQVRLSVIARNTPRHSIDLGQTNAAERNLISYESHSSADSADSTTPLNASSSRPSHDVPAPALRQMVRTGSFHADINLKGQQSSPAPSLHEYLEAAEESLSARTSRSSSRLPSPKSAVSKLNLAEKDVEEDTLLGAPFGSTNEPSTRSDFPRSLPPKPKPRSVSSPPNLSDAERGTPNVARKLKFSPPSTGHSPSNASCGKNIDIISFSPPPNSGKLERRSSIRDRRSLDPLFLNPELSVDREDDDICSVHSDLSDLSADDDTEASKSYTIDVKGSETPTNCSTTSAASTAQKAMEYVLDFKQETNAQDFGGKDLGAELRQLEEIGVPSAHLEKIAAALGNTSFVSTTTTSQHKRNASEVVLPSSNQPRVALGGKSAHGDFSGRGSQQPQAGARTTQMTLGNVAHKRASSLRDVHDNAVDSLQHSGGRVGKPRTGLLAAQRAHNSLAMSNPSLGLIPRPQPVRPFKSLNSLDTASASLMTAPLPPAVDPPARCRSATHTASFNKEQPVNPCESEAHVSVPAAGARTPPPMGTPKSDALARRHDGNSPLPFHIRQTAVSVGLDL